MELHSRQLQLLLIIQLVVDQEDRAITFARQLINRPQQEINIEPQRRQLVELVGTIFSLQVSGDNYREDLKYVWVK